MTTCPECNGTGQRDSGGVHPWGEPIHLACDCKDAEIGRQWREDSSLEKWFPLTAERLAALEAENAALKREAHTWSKAAEHYAKLPPPLDPVDVEELWDVANADPYADEVHQEFARLVQRKLGIGG